MAQRILIVEDNRDLCELLGLYLRAGGYQTSQAENSAEGIRKALAERPDLILTDLHLPDMSAVEATEKLKQDSATSGIPIVVLTAMPLGDWKPKALRAGVAECLTKPISPAELLKVIGKLIRTTSLFTER
jgi:CheY-like chemotaxis protein